jgi:hypothetical protein
VSEWGYRFSSEEIVYEIHLAVVGALVELGLEAYAFRRRGNVRENIVIRVEGNKPNLVVWTAFVDGTTLAIGRGDLYVYKSFDLNDPGCFEEVVAFLCGNPVMPDGAWFRDERLWLGDIIESWVKVTPGFHLNPEGERNCGWA